MLNFIYVLLTVLMFLDCVLLVFLVLLQLPKKEAGAGMAFGGAATDALIGAGSGNVLTKITKYVAGIFFGLALFMAILTAHRPKTGAALLLQEVTKHGSIPVAPITPSQSTPVAPVSGGLLQLTNAAPATPAPSTPAPSTAPPPAEKK